MRYAVVTGSNKGIGLEICRQLVSKGVYVVLTARDAKRGQEAVEHLQTCGFPNVIFHQLDLLDVDSIDSLATFIKNQYGKLDILVNNAGVGGVIVDWEAFRLQVDHVCPPHYLSPSDNLSDFKRILRWFSWPAIENALRLSILYNILLTPSAYYIKAKGNTIDLLKSFTKQTYKMAEECLKTNYHGTKGVTEALLTYLLLSKSGRIVNLSASVGKLKSIPSESIRKALTDIDSLKRERIDEILHQFLQDFKNNLLESKGWPVYLSAYIVSKAAMNAYTRILAKENPSLCVNCVCPGFVKTDINSHMGVLTVEEGAQGPVMLALLPECGSSGQFFDKVEVSNF